MAVSIQAILSLLLLLAVSVAVAGEARLDRYDDPLPAGAVARYGSARLVHAGVEQLAFSPGGKFLASRSGGELRLWDAKAGTLLRQLAPVRNFEFTPDALLTTHANELRLVEIATGKVLRTLDRRKAKASAREVVVSGDGKTAAVTWVGEGVMLYDLAAANEVKPRLLCADDLEYLRLSATGHRLVGLKGQGMLALSEIQVWDVAAGKTLRTINMNYQPNTGEGVLALSADGSRVASVEITKLHVWVTDTGRPVRGFKPPEAEVSQLRFAADGKTLLGVHKYRGMIAWSVDTGKVTARHSHNDSWRPRALSDDGLTLAGIDEHASARIRIWDARTGKERVAADPPPRSVRFVRPGRIAVRTNDAWCFLGAEGQVIDRVEMKGWGELLSPDGRYVVKQGEGFPANDAVVTELIGGKVVSRLPIHGTIHRFSPDGKLLLAWLNTPEKPEPRDDEPEEVSYQLWEVATGRLVRTLTVSGDGDEPGISPDGRTLVSCDEDIAFIEISTGKVRERLDAPPAPRLPDYAFNGRGENPWRKYQFSRDGRSLMVARNRDVFVIDLKTGLPAIQLLADDNYSGTLSPDARWLATVRGRAVEVRDLRNPRAVFDAHRFEGHEGRVDTLSFSPDGRSLLSSGNDGTVVIWDMQPLIEGAAKRPPAADEARLAAWWDALGGKPEKTGAAMRALENEPARAVALIASRLTPVKELPAEQITKWIAELDSGDFDRREKAAKELEQLAELAEPALRDVLKKGPSAELKRRAERLLQRLDAEETMPERLQALRAVEILERIGTPEARKVLEALAKGAPAAKFTREAKATLERWPVH